MLVAELVENGLSLNKALRLVGLSKSSYFYRSKKASYEETLARRIKELALENPVYGYRRLWFLIQKEGFEVSLKKFYRLYRKLGLSLCPRKKRGWRRTPRTEEAFPIEVARKPSKRWSMDFKEERLADGKVPDISSHGRGYPIFSGSVVGQKYRWEDGCGVL